MPMDFLILSIVFLVAATIAVPLASKLGLGSVLGYLLAGVAISPLLNAFNVDVVSLQHFAELGVVMMLFLVGLELEPKLIWSMKTRLLGLGGLQVTLTTVAVTGVALMMALPMSVALTVGLIFSLSSTAIVLQTLNEKGLLKSNGGQASFSVLLFQDIAVIPMMALVPVLADPALMESLNGLAQAGHIDVGHAAADSQPLVIQDWINDLPSWQRAMVTIGSVALVLVGGAFLTRPVFRFIAVAQLRELFVGSALLFVMGITFLMQLVDLSPALGAFLAGVVLATSEYRHELESDIQPFKGLLLGLFFMTVGASINFALFSQDPWLIIGLTLGLVALKAVVLAILSYVFGVGGSDRWMFALGLAQAGEFGFVLLSFAVANDALPMVIADRLLLVVAMSMVLTPALFILHDRLIAPRFVDASPREPDEIDEEAPIIIAGHGRWGGIVNRMLIGAGYRTVVLDHDSSRLERLSAFKIKAFFGDATRPDLLEAAGIDHAKLLVVAIGDNNEQATRLVSYVTKHYPDVHVIARAHDRLHVYRLFEAGCRDIIRETFDGGVRAGRSAFEAIGVASEDAHRLAKDFEVSDRHALAELAPLYRSDIPIHKNEAYVARALELRDTDTKQ